MNELEKLNRVTEIIQDVMHEVANENMLVDALDEACQLIEEVKSLYDRGEE